MDSFSKPKDIRDSNSNPDERKRKRDSTLDFFRQSWQRQESSSSDHPEMSDHSFADFRPSQRKVRLKNGSEVLAGDIPPIMTSLQKMNNEIKATGLQVSIYRKSERLLVYYDDRKKDEINELEGKWRSMIIALYDLERKCKNPDYKIGDDYSKLLEEWNFIDKDTGQPKDSVREIVLFLSENKCLDKSKIVPSIFMQERVILRNGAEEDPALVKMAMSLLRSLREENPGAVSEFHKLYQDPNHALDNTIAEVLKSKNLIIDLRKKI